jgi:hypothetical protein
MHPEWGTSFGLSSSNLYTFWFANNSYSTGNLGIAYNLTGLGIYGVTYSTSSRLDVQILTPNSTTEACLSVIKDDSEPLVSLGKQNFKFYNYSTATSTWQLINPTSQPVAYANGTYTINLPSGVDAYSYLVQVQDPRGIVVIASSYSRYSLTLGWNSTFYAGLSDPTLVVELLQNGTMRWLGENLQVTTQTKPIPPIPVRAMHVNQTINGVNQEVPFQVEDWASDFKIPLGLTSNQSVFGSRNMLVFLTTPTTSKVTLWWNGSDIENQTSYAFTNRYFTDTPDVDSGTLQNGILRLDVLSSGSDFQIRSVLGGANCTARFLRINNDWSTYGSKPVYTIFNGIVRDIIHGEGEWSGGIANCPNVYAHMVLTLPANATYYTYQFRLMFVDSQQARTISDLCLVQIQSNVSKTQWGANWSDVRTENGTSAGYPVLFNLPSFFYNKTTVWQHAWSEMIEGNHGFGFMTRIGQNQRLYTFDTIAGAKTGGINVTNSTSGSRQTVTMEMKPASSLSTVSFTYALDVVWYGAVATFDGQKPIYPDSGGTAGLWVTVEYPPTVTVSVES